MAVYQLHFFKELWYVIDFVVVLVAIILEFTIKSPAGGLLVLLIMWRLIRVVHGITSTIELQEKQKHSKHSKLRRAHKQELVIKLYETLAKVKQARSDCDSDVNVAKKDLDDTEGFLETTIKDMMAEKVHHEPKTAKSHVAGRVMQRRKSLTASEPSRSQVSMDSIEPNKSEALDKDNEAEFSVEFAK